MSSQTHLQKLCLEHTELRPEDIQILGTLAAQLPMMADLSQADLFIDCLSRDRESAIVVAEAKPTTASSLYLGSVIGQFAYAQHEPAVMYCLLSGKPVTGSRAISQEQKEMQQNVVPIQNQQGQPIGVLILERDITHEVQQEMNVAFLKEKTEQLGKTLLHLALQEDRTTGLMHEGMILFDAERHVTYSNRSAEAWLMRLGMTEELEVRRWLTSLLPKERNVLQNQMLTHEVVSGTYALEVKSMLLYEEGHPVGGLLLIRDLSELKEREKELVLKSAFIQEMHHRVKNNLQTVAGLLRLQVRRTQHEEVKQTYRDMIQRMNSIALIHDILAYKGLDQINLYEVIHRLCPMVIHSLTDPDQNIRCDLPAMLTLWIEPEQATTLALIVTELIQNSIKHGFGDAMNQEPIITITLHQSADMVTMALIDNGAGIHMPNRETSVSARGGSHFGLNMVRTLAQGQLNGTFRFEGTEHGAVAELQFPLSNGGRESE
ncbi:sensor histidine kinase [Paenibacillus terrigena]|uniref:sensor histidine kinase n=1 Tax=Paenibacillus terrigena TaxID=369333 RepID=UPI000367F123|nr:histidine kinase N-terminal domain-containing protein [Paenibacillus terrigena]